MNVVDTPVAHWDPFKPTYFYDPYPAFKVLRETAPIYYNDEYDFFAVSCYEQCQMVLGDRDTFSSRHGTVIEMIKNKTPIPKGLFIASDPPGHGVHRSVLARIFTPKRMQALEPQIRAFCARALDPLEDGGDFDFVQDFGAVLPGLVIGMLLGIPADQLAEFRQRLEDRTRAQVLGQPRQTDEAGLRGEHFADYINWREKNPADDAMTELLNVEFVDETGEKRKLTKGEILVFANLLFAAGNETTNRLIGWTGKLLADYPDQRRDIAENRALIPQAIEELLRFQSPAPSVARYVAKDTEVLGVKVPEGNVMLSLVASANRDDAKFPDGDSFNIHRERAPHLAFGFGFHNCLGNALARVESRIAMDELLSRFPEWEVDMAGAVMRPNTSIRGWDTLPIHLPKARHA
jgi:cytochrome P450